MIRNLLHRLAALEPKLPHDEPGYCRAYFRNDLWLINITLVFFSAMYGLWTFKDMEKMSNRFSVWPLVALRLACFVLSIIFFITQSNRVEQILKKRLLFAIAIVILAHQMLNMAYRPLDYAFTSYTSILILVIFYFMFPFGLGFRMGLSLCLSVFDLAFCLIFKQYPPGGQFTLVITYILVNIFGIVWSTNANTMRRKQYQNFITLRKEKEHSAFLNRTFSHDVRASFSGLMFHYEMLAKAIKAGDREKSVSLITSIGALTRSAWFMTENLLEWDGRETRKSPTTRVDAVQVLQDSLDFFSLMREQKRILLETSMQAPLMVEIDVRAFQVVLRNLLHNACKFTPEGGHIRMSLQRRDDRMILELFNDGEAISRDTVEKSMRLDQWPDRHGGTVDSGTGLGLGICYNLAAKHGWMLELLPQWLVTTGAGTLARLTLPVPVEAPFGSPPRAASGVPPGVALMSTQASPAGMMACDIEASVGS